MKSLNNILAAHGKVIILVPANKGLYSTFDKNLGHFRRYSKKELKKKIENSGFKVRKIIYFNSAGAVGWYLRLKIGNAKNLVEGDTKAFNYLLPIFKIVDKHIIRNRFGLSLIVIGEKP